MSVELYEFRFSPGGVWYFTNKRFFDVSFMGNTYERIRINRGRWDRRVDRDDLKITADATIEPFSLIVNALPANPQVTLREVDGTRIMDGVIVGAKYAYNKAAVELTVRNWGPRLGGSLPQRDYGAGCDWRLGKDPRCGVNLVAGISRYTNGTFPGGIPFALDLGYGALSPNGRFLSNAQFSNYTPTGHLDNPGKDCPVPPSGPWFSGGTAINLDTSEEVLIAEHDPSAGEIVLLQDWFVKPSTATTIRFLAGCFKDVTTCDCKFDNLANGTRGFGGFPSVPPKNPNQGF